MTKFQKLRVSLFVYLLLISYGRYCNNLIIPIFLYRRKFYFKTEKKISDAIHKQSNYCGRVSISIEYVLYYDEYNNIIVCIDLDCIINVKRWINNID